MLDPVLIQAACSRLIVWMMAGEYYNMPVVRHVFRAVQAIPVNRSGKDLAATRAAFRVLDRGMVLGIFPEGRLSPTYDLLPFQTGVAMMARKTGVKIYPAGLEGTHRGDSAARSFAIPHRAAIAFGNPLEIGDQADLTACSAGLQDHVKILLFAAQKRLGWHAPCNQSHVGA